MKAKRFSGAILFIGTSRVEESKTTPIPWQTDFNYTNKGLELYDKKMRAIAERNKCGYLGVDDILNGRRLDADGLHPNSEGHEKLFLRVRDFLVEKGILKV